MGLRAKLCADVADEMTKFVMDDRHRQQGAMAQKMVNALNVALKADKPAMHALLISRVASPAMIEDPHMICDGHGSIGLLGVLNGCLAAAGLPKIAVKWKGDEETLDSLECFQLYDPPDTCVK